MNYEAKAEKQLESCREQRTARILAIETSCEETGAAVVEDGRRISVSYTHLDVYKRQRLAGQEEEND